MIRNARQPALFPALVALGLSLVITPLLAATVDVTVKETAGVGASAYPTTVVIPLPRGQHQNVNGFSLGVPAQFEVIERWTKTDNSIRHVAAHFQASVSPAGQTTYNFTTDGTNPAPPDPVQVSQAGDTITVTTGPIRFTVNRSVFNILDTVWFDSNQDGTYATSERIILPSNDHGGRFDGCGNVSGGSCSPQAQHDTSLSPDTVEIEESGPMRAVIRLERFTHYNGRDDHKRGYVVRLYAYAGKPFIKVDYQLANAATGPALDSGRYSKPLYFQSFDLQWDLELNGAVTVKTSDPHDGNDQIDSRTLDSNGVELAHTLHDKYQIRRSNGTNAWVNRTDNSYSDMWLDVRDSNRGVQAVIRNGWEMWPNGLEVTDSSSFGLQVQLWPEWSANYYYTGSQLSPSGLYWLDDMRAVYKEVLLGFHGASTPDYNGDGSSNDNDLKALAKTFDRYPVPTLPASYYYSTGVTLDLDGSMSPYSSEYNDGNNALLDTLAPRDLDESNDYYYHMGWDRYYANWVNRLDDTRDPGGGLFGYEKFIATGSPDDYWHIDRLMIGEMNNKPQWMQKDYTFADDFSRINLEMQPYSGGTWRAQYDTQSWSIPQTGKQNLAADDQHFWMYYMGGWLYDYNLWTIDWWHFIGEMMRSRYVADTEDEAERAQGHSAWANWMAYRATGDNSLIEGFADHVAGPLKADQSVLCGRQNGNLESSSSLEKGWLSKSYISSMNELKGYDWQRWADVFLYVSAYMEWDYHYGRYDYHPDDPNFGGGGQCSTGVSSGTAWPTPDGVAWYYWNTGKARFKTQNETYVNSGINGGSRPYTGTQLWPSSYRWDGSIVSRTYYTVNGASRPDSTPPASVNDVGASLAGNTLNVTWTTPSDAAYYLVVWADKSIVECISNCSSDSRATNTAAYRNWWAAKPAAADRASACSSNSCTLNISGVNADPAYVAVFSFDAANNMSAMSNVATSSPGQLQPPAAPGSLRVR